MSSRHVLFPSGTAAHRTASNSTVNSTVLDDKLKEGSSPEHEEEEEDRGDEELMKSVRLRPNNTLVSILKPVEYLIHDLIKSRYMTQRNDDGVPVMEKMSLKKLFRGVFQIQIYQDLNKASEVWCSVQHKLTKKYLSVSCRRSVNFTELVLSRSPSIPDDDDDNNTISLEMAGNHSGTDTVNLSESFPSSTPSTLQHGPARQICLREESAQIPPENCLWGFDPNQDHVCLAPKKFPKESLIWQEKDGRVVLVNKAGFKAFKCVFVDPELRRQIKSAKFCAILRFMHNLLMGLGAED